MDNTSSDLTPAGHGLALDSAVVAFWKLLEPRPEPLARYPRHAKVHDLPTELLLIIFKHVHAEIIAERLFERWMEVNIDSPSLFPYAIAAVCSRWKAIMSSLPEFWTRIVIVIDLVPTTPPATVLSWSRDLPLQVVVTRVILDHTVDVQHEQDQVVSIMKTLVDSHIHRSRKLRFNVVFSSSLPPFPDSFRGACNNLRELCLQCQEDNGGSTDGWGSISSEQQPEFPELESLHIDGRNYYEICRKDLRWTVRFPSVRDLTISHFTPCPGESFTSTGFLLPTIALPSLGNLRINNLSLQPAPALMTSPPNLQWGGDHIEFSHISDFAPIADILNLLPAIPAVSLTRCAIGCPTKSFNRAGCLTLRDIDANLKPLLRRWAGKYLKVNNCPRFNDAVIDTMAADYPYAPYMRQLTITDCPNFSVAALKRLVSARLTVDEWGRGPADRALSAVCIYGLAPDISIEDQAHINQRVDHFEYKESPS